MKLATVLTRAQLGIHAPLVRVETHLSNGLPAFSIVGLAETAVKESKERVRSAILNSKFKFPLQRITINLAPADLPKEGGGRFDLPIALGILIASGQLNAETIAEYEFVGELALSGTIRKIKGSIATAIYCKKDARTLILPQENGYEATLSDCNHFVADHLLHVCAHLEQRKTLQKFSQSVIPKALDVPDMQDIKGQQHAKRALEIAAAGNHSMLLVGPPGTGKTMLASRLVSILPPVTQDEALEIASIYSMSHHGFKSTAWKKRPFRAPHHTASAVALVGGGSNPRPGEITLAHFGVLFLDELPEFERKVLEVLREPLESGQITISRANRQAKYPAKFQLIAAMNPCPCGYYGTDIKECRCRPEQIQRYHNKLSGPLLDRIDLHIEVPALPVEYLIKAKTIDSENSATIQARVIDSRQRQYQRQQTYNAALTVKDLETHSKLSETSRGLLLNAVNKLQLSARSYHRILKVARTIADINQSPSIETEHVAEAISFRSHLLTQQKGH